MRFGTKYFRVQEIDNGYIVTNDYGTEKYCDDLASVATLMSERFESPFPKTYIVKPSEE